MTITAAFAVILAVSASAQQPPVTPPAGQKPLSPAEMASRSSAQVEKAYTEMMGAMAKAERCFNAETALTESFARKKRELAAEFGGKIPSSFDDLLWTRTQRLSRQHAECVRSHAEVSRLLDEAYATLRHTVPVSPNYKAQKAKIDVQKDKVQKMLPGGPARKASSPVVPGGKQTDGE